MKKNLVKTLSVILLYLMCTVPVWASSAAENAEQPVKQVEAGVEAPHAVLMEISTGAVLFEKDAHTASAPASVTKIMTMLLIFDALEEGKIKLEDSVSVSEHAASMGGSQVFLEPNEKQTVDTMLKCIAIASANDACVAMAEYISGSEEAFVAKMNERAKGLGMENTNFVNCNGLDAEGHVASAYDIALMSRELLLKYPQVHEYCATWMDTITHTTSKGSTEFGLSNTNKLIKQYEYCTGLKTGSTSNAGFCVSASAKKDDMELIAVVMNGETSKSRFQDAKELLNCGYANYMIYKDTGKERNSLPEMEVRNGVKTKVELAYGGDFSTLLGNGENPSEVQKTLELPEWVQAPVAQGEKIGRLVYVYGEKKLGEIAVIAKETVEAAKYIDYVKRVWLAWMM